MIDYTRLFAYLMLMAIFWLLPLTLMCSYGSSRRKGKEVRE